LTARKSFAERAVPPQFYGDRNGGVKDLAGKYWWIATHKEDVSPEEVAQRAAALKK
jgi:PhnB protein